MIIFTMETLTTEKFYVIESATQYKRYCEVLEKLVFEKRKSTEDKKNIKLLTLLIETWEEQQASLKGRTMDPVQLLAYLMEENSIRAKDLAERLDIGKSLVSDILHYRKGMSKEVIRKLADIFKLSQDAFNKPYELIK